MSTGVIVSENVYSVTVEAESWEMTEAGKTFFVIANSYAEAEDIAKRKHGLTKVITNITQLGECWRANYAAAG